MASKPLICAVFDFHHKQIFPRVKDYFSFHDFDHASRDLFNATLLRNLEKSQARKITSALVIEKDVKPLLTKPGRLSQALKIRPLSEAQEQSNQQPDKKYEKDLSYFHSLLDYSLNRTFLNLDDFFAAHYLQSDKKKERELILQRVHEALDQQRQMKHPVLHCFSDVVSELTIPDIKRCDAKRYLDYAIKVKSLASLEENKELVLRFYGFREIEGNPLPGNSIKTS